MEIHIRSHIPLHNGYTLWTQLRNRIMDVLIIYTMDDYIMDYE